MARPKHWTDARIEEIAKELEAWFMEDEENVFYQSFFGRRKDLYPEMISRFQSVNEMFRQTIKRIEQIQQERLIKKGFKSPIMAIFCLKANHGWKDTHHVVTENHNYNHQDKQELAKLDAEGLKDRLRFLTEAAKN